MPHFQKILSLIGVKQARKFRQVLVLILIDFHFISQSRQEEISKVECLDTGKPLWEARFDIASMADSIEYFGGLAPTVTGM